jgi:hypothetical protein
MSVVADRLDVALVSSVLGIKPTETTDDRPIRLGPDAGKDGWHLEVPKREEEDLDNVLTELLTQIQGDWAKIGSALQTLQASVAVEAGSQVRSGRRPQIILSRSTVGVLAALAAEFMIDWYDNCED